MIQNSIRDQFYPIVEAHLTFEKVTSHHPKKVTSLTARKLWVFLYFFQAQKLPPKKSHEKKIFLKSVPTHLFPKPTKQAVYRYFDAMCLWEVEKLLFCNFQFFF